MIKTSLAIVLLSICSPNVSARPQGIIDTILEGTIGGVALTKLKSRCTVGSRHCDGEWYSVCIDSKPIWESDQCPPGTVCSLENTDSFNCDATPTAPNPNRGRYSQTPCDGKPDGFYGDFDYKNVFWKCLDGNRIWYKCDEPLVFNEVVGLCDWPDNVEEPTGESVL